MNQDNNFCAFKKNDIHSIFKNKPKPISYVKGDIAYISEMSEDSLIITNRGTGNIMAMRNEIIADRSLNKNGSKKGFSDDEIITEKQINIDINKEYWKDESDSKKYYNEINRQNNKENIDSISANAPASMVSKSSNKKMDIDTFNNFDNRGIRRRESDTKSQGQAQEKSNILKRYQSEHMLPCLIKKGINSNDDTDPFIFSWTDLHVLSFLTGAKTVKHHSKNNYLHYPSPTLIDHKAWQKKPNLSKEEIMYGMIVDDKKGLVLIDKNITKKFRGIISDMIKQILSVWLKPISLKVVLFEPKSTLQRIADYWSFAPQYLNKAALADSPLERMKYVIAFAAAGFYIPTKQLKPFNPLIGETFQGEFENGAKVYVEHISHYPNYARFLIIDQNYKIHGFFDFNVKTESLTGSKICVTQQGPITIEFVKSKEKVIYNMPAIRLLNASSEEGRASIWTGTIVFSDVKNNLQAFLQFGQDEKYIHGFNGLIYEYQFPQGIYNHYEYVKKCEGLKNWINKPNNNLPTKIIGNIKGSWLKDLRLDEELLWDINTNIPNWIRPTTSVLPSDGRFREDLIWLFRSFNSTTETQRLKYEEYAQGWKAAIETVQRAEREIRKKNKKKKK